MAHYESILVLKPTLSEADLAGFMDKTKQALVKDGGEVLGFEAWGRRKLAHPIDKIREGIYACLKYKAPAPLRKKMAQDFRLDDQIIREMTTVARERRLREKKVKVKDHKDAPARLPSAPRETAA